MARRFLFLSLFGFAAGCATTTPSGPTTGYTENLRLCNKTFISNAPAADRSGHIIGYAPLINVRGVNLARAPVRACLSSGFGPRRGGAGSLHKGIDLYTGDRRAVYAAASGRIVNVGVKRGFGQTILIRHRNGVTTRYAHLSSFTANVHEGARINAGQVIGRTGRTGNATAVHLHYEIIVDGVQINPLH